MDISWLGHACVRVRSRQTAVVMDPCDKASGFDMGRPTADIVTISNDDPHHSNRRGVRGQPLEIDGPGEYEVGGVQITGVATYLEPPTEGQPARRNTAYVVEGEELRLAHLGGLGAPLTAEQAEQLSNVDILVVPIGAGGAFDAEQAARTVRTLEPKVVIPVHYAVTGRPVKGGDGGDDSPLKKFITAAGVEPEQGEQRLTIQRRGLGETLRIVLLEPRGS